jgi:NAD(P)-dependent dehydrogenase (short-subunit alcohol dehydrogenase family)
VTAKTAERSVTAAMNTFGRLDCLVNAGPVKWAPVRDTTTRYDEVIETSLKAPVSGFARAALPGSRLVHQNVGSTFHWSAV